MGRTSRGEWRALGRVDAVEPNPLAGEREGVTMDDPGVTGKDAPLRRHALRCRRAAASNVLLDVAPEFHRRLLSAQERLGESLHDIDAPKERAARHATGDAPWGGRAA